MPILPILLALLVVTFCPHVLAAAPQDRPRPLSEDWKRVRGSAFEVVGNASASELQHVADSLEEFRHALRLIFPGVRTEGASPVRVVVFRDQRAMRLFTPTARGKRQEDLAGYFLSQPDIHYMVLAPRRGAGTYRVLLHEFTHYVVRLNAPGAPLWLDEGLAELYSTFSGSDQDSRPMIGGPLPDHLATLGREPLIPLSVLLSPDARREAGKSRSRTAVFYAQSWALVHYLLLGEQGRNQGALRTFLGQQSGRAPLDVQFRSAFGMDFGEMERALRGYVHRTQMPAVRVQRPDALVSPAAEPMREADALHIQGDLLARLGYPKEAERYVRQAAAIEPGHPGARLSLARCRMQQHRLEEALAIVEPVVRSAPDSFAAHRLHGELLLSLERYAEAVRAYNRALGLNPEDATSFFGASVAQLALGQPHAARTFDAVLRLDPNPEWHRARMYAAWRVGRSDAVIHEGREYLRKEGWVADASVYVALGVALEHLRRGQTREAARLLTEAAGHVDRKTWVAHLVQYLRGRTTDAELLKRARSMELLTEAYAYVGVKASIEGRTGEAVRRLQWVEAKGDQSLVEYQIAIRELRRLGMPDVGRTKAGPGDDATVLPEESTPLREARPSHDDLASSF